MPISKTLKIDANQISLEQLERVVSWQLDPMRNAVLGVDEFIEKIYIIAPSTAILPQRISSKIDELEHVIKDLGESNSITSKEIIREIVVNHIKRAISVYIYDKGENIVKFVESSSEIIEEGVFDIDSVNEIDTINRMKEQINRRKGVGEDNRDDIRNALKRVVLPEFDRVEVQSTNNHLHTRRFFSTELERLFEVKKAEKKAKKEAKKAKKREKKKNILT